LQLQAAALYEFDEHLTRLHRNSTHSTRTLTRPGGTASLCGSSNVPSARITPNVSIIVAIAIVLSVAGNGPGPSPLRFLRQCLQLFRDPLR